MMSRILRDLTSSLRSELAVRATARRAERLAEERRRAEHALETANRRLITVIESQADGFFILDEEGQIAYVNAPATRLLWRSRQDLLGTDARTLFPSDRESPWALLFTRGLADREALQFETQWSGAARWFGVRALPTEDGLIVHLREITDQKRLEARIRDLEETLASGPPEAAVAPEPESHAALRRRTRELETRIDRLSALRHLDLSIASGLDLGITLGILLDQARSLLGVDAACVLLLDRHSQTLDYTAGRGFRSPGISASHLVVPEGAAGLAVCERRTLGIPTLPDAPGRFGRESLIADEGFVTYHAVPMLAKGQVFGVLEVFHRTPLPAGPDWLDFLETLAAEAALAADRATLVDDLQRTTTDLALLAESVLQAWGRALDLRERQPAGHSGRVADLATRVARHLGMPDPDLAHLRRGALLHDVGKLGVPDAILLKAGPLTDQEWVVMRTHPLQALDLLGSLPVLRPALDIPYSHHEKWDGSGYPRRLRGEQIPLGARIVAVVDTWEALRADRPFRQGWSDARAREYLQIRAGTNFDPRVLEAFFQIASGE